MSNMPYRQRLLAMLDALPQAEPLLAIDHRSHSNEALSAMEHLAIELRLQTQALRITHSLLPELQATAILECVVGPLPAQDAQAICRRMLEFNFREAQTQALSLSIDPARGEVVLSTPLNLSTATADDLAALIRSSLRTALAWRTSGLLGAASTPDAQATPTASWTPLLPARA